MNSRNIRLNAALQVHTTYYWIIVWFNSIVFFSSVYFPFKLLQNFLGSFSGVRSFGSLLVGLSYCLLFSLIRLFYVHWFLANVIRVTRDFFSSVVDTNLRLMPIRKYSPCREARLGKWGKKKTRESPQQLKMQCDILNMIWKNRSIRSMYSSIDTQNMSFILPMVYFLYPVPSHAPHVHETQLRNIPKYQTHTYFIIDSNWDKCWRCKNDKTNWTICERISQKYQHFQCM